MRIESSSLNFASRHDLVQRTEKRETLRAWVGDRRPDFERSERAGGAERGADDVREARRALLREAAEPPRRVHHHPPVSAADQVTAKAKTDAEEANQEIDGDSKLQVLIALIERTTGHRIRRVKLEAATADAPKLEGVDSAAAANTPAPPPRQGWGVEYDSVTRVAEHEQTTFAAEGVVKTADGKEIKLNLDLQMTRDYVSEERVSIRAGDAVRKDPLVINYGGSAAELLAGKTEFDVDADGKADQIATLQPGSAYLALDLNGDGAINDGSELFGTKSGDGFADLARYDDDHNGWIDEGDAVFSRLKLWNQAAGGTSSLQSIQAQQIGAIYLGRQATPFELKDANNQSLGAVRSTGIFLRENGSVGSVQQIDLTV
ncbi:MAG: hypothetical protein U0821_16945 [Chloroflexota bacterium]